MAAENPSLPLHEQIIINILKQKMYLFSSYFTNISQHYCVYCFYCFHLIKCSFGDHKKLLKKKNILQTFDWCA